MIVLDAIEAVIDFLTLRSLWKKKPEAIERAMSEAYAQSDESKKLDELSRVASNSAPENRKK